MPRVADEGVLTRLNDIIPKLAFCVVGLACAGCMSPPSFTVAEQADSVRSAVLRFPSWMRQDDPSQPYAANRYLLRRQDDELLVRAGTFGAGRSVESYAISLADPFQVRRISFDTWETADPVEASRGKNLRRSDDLTVTHEGRLYKAMGTTWEDAEVSPGGRWLLLHTFDDEDWVKVDTDFFFCGNDPRTGATYLEIYDTATGNRVFAARSRSTDQVVYDDVQWVGEGDQYLMMPVADFSLRGQNCLFVLLPEAEPEEE